MEEEIQEIPSRKPILVYTLICLLLVSAAVGVFFFLSTKDDEVTTTTTPSPTATPSQSVETTISSLSQELDEELATLIGEEENSNEDTIPSGL